VAVVLLRAEYPNQENKMNKVKSVLRNELFQCFAFWAIVWVLLWLY